MSNVVLTPERMAVGTKPHDSSAEHDRCTKRVAFDILNLNAIHTNDNRVQIFA